MPGEVILNVPALNDEQGFQRVNVVRKIGGSIFAASRSRAAAKGRQACFAELKRKAFPSGVGRRGPLPLQGREGAEGSDRRAGPWIAR